MKAKKHLGQHFLIDQQVIGDILQQISQHCPLDEAILEVGPGPGVLTYRLAETYNQFRAVEFDRDMIAILVQKLSPELLINENFLTVDLSSVFDGKSFSLVGNFPYNISSQIIFKMLDNLDLVPKMVGMFQKEVANRICAEPGSKANGILSLLAQAYYKAEKLFEIGPQAFNPPPKVDSAVIALTRKEDYTLPCDFKIYKKIIKASFQQRRKKLRNTLKPFLHDLDLELLQKRPEQLGVEEFVSIAQIIESQDR